MKNLISTIFAVLCIVWTVNVTAQSEAIMAGSSIASGSVTFSSDSGDAYEDSNGDGTTTFGIMLDYQYLVINNLGVGLDLGFESEKQGDYKSSSFFVGPQVNYFFQYRRFFYSLYRCSI